MTGCQKHEAVHRGWRADLDPGHDRRQCAPFCSSEELRGVPHGLALGSPGGSSASWCRTSEGAGLSPGSAGASVGVVSHAGAKPTGAGNSNGAPSPRHASWPRPGRNQERSEGSGTVARRSQPQGTEQGREGWAWSRETGENHLQAGWGLIHSSALYLFIIFLQ